MISVFALYPEDDVFQPLFYISWFLTFFNFFGILPWVLEGIAGMQKFVFDYFSSAEDLTNKSFDLYEIIILFFRRK